ncbi:MAG: PEP-CTERM sorting domain-containing protein [Armatimonadota bacterium]
MMTRWCRTSVLVIAASLMAAMPAIAELPPPVSVSFDLVKGTSADLFTWSGDVALYSLDFAGGTWDITATPASWTRASDGLSFWWEASVPGAQFEVENGSGEWLRGTGELALTIFAGDSSYSTVEVGLFGFDRHQMGINGALTEGYLTGNPPIIGGTFTTFPATISGMSLAVSGGDPVAGPCGAEFGLFGSGVFSGEAQPTPEPCTWVLLLASGGIVGALRRRKTG